MPPAIRVGANSDLDVLPRMPEENLLWLEEALGGYHAILHRWIMPDGRRIVLLGDEDAKKKELNVYANVACTQPGLIHDDFHGPLVFVMETGKKFDDKFTGLPPDLLKEIRLWRHESSMLPFVTVGAALLPWGQRVG